MKLFDDNGNISPVVILVNVGCNLSYPDGIFAVVIGPESINKDTLVEDLLGTLHFQCLWEIGIPPESVESIAALSSQDLDDLTLEKIAETPSPDFEETWLTIPPLERVEGLVCNGMQPWEDMEKEKVSTLIRVSEGILRDLFRLRSEFPFDPECDVERTDVYYVAPGVLLIPTEPVEEDQFTPLLDIID